MAGFVGGITSEATSQVIIGLTANGIDPAGEQFTKNGISLIDHLLEFKNDDGGFKHTMDYADSDLMATEQALQALVAYDLFLNGKGSVYQFEIESNEQLPEEEEKGEEEVPEEESDTPNTDEDQETPEEDEGIKDTINVELSDQAIEIKPNSLVTINQTEATIQLPANLPSGTTLKVKQAHIETPGLRKAGALYQFDFNYPSGKENFKGDFYLTLAVDSTIDINKVAIYYYNETTKEWEYIGGKASDGQITALVHHFSTYGVFIEEANESDQEVEPAENENQSSVPENEEPKDDEGQSLDDEGTVQEEQQVKATTEAGEMLPETATDLYNFILAGVILIVLGGALFIYRTKRHV